MVELEGVRIAVENRPGDISAITFLFSAGSKVDPPGREGLANFTGEMLLRGTEELSREEFLRKAEKLGEIEIYAEPDSLVVNLTAEHRNMRELLILFLEALASPAFREEEIEKAKMKLKGELNSLFQSPQELVRYLFPFHLFPGHPYGHSPQGTLEGIDSISVEDIKNFFSLIGKKGMVVSIVSPYPETELRVLEEFLSSWDREGQCKEIQIPSFRDSTERIKKKGISQSYIEMATYLPPVKALNEAALVVFNAIFGGSFTSRLVQQIRVKHGLTYSIYSRLEWREGFTLLNVSTSTYKEDEVLVHLEREINNIHKGIGEEELLRAKQYVKGNYPLKFERAEFTSFFIARRLFFGLEEKSLSEFLGELEDVKRNDIEVIISSIYRKKFIFVLGP